MLFFLFQKLPINYSSKITFSTIQNILRKIYFDLCKKLFKKNTNQSHLDIIDSLKKFLIFMRNSQFILTKNLFYSQFILNLNFLMRLFFNM